MDLTRSTISVVGSSNVGGLVGYVANSNIGQCYATGNVDGTFKSSSSYCGGFAGLITNSTVQNCFSTGDVIGTLSYYSYSAGFVGYITSSTVANCYSLSSNPNGFVQSGTVTNCYFNKDLLSASSTKAQSRTTNEMAIQSTYVGWDFENVWVMGEMYPLLRGFEAPVIESASLIIINDKNMPIEIVPNKQGRELYLIGEMVTIKVLPSDEWMFVEWQDDNGNTVSIHEEYSFIITGDMVLILICEELVDTEESEELEKPV